MTALPGYAPRRAHVPYWLIAATLAAAFIAVMPIVAAVFVGTSTGTRTAFAGAAAGEYAVIVRSEETFDVVLAAPIAGGEPVEVTRISHLPGYGIKGQVSPSGRQLAVLVPDAGSVARPGTSLAVVDLETGASLRLANAVDDALAPVWNPAGDRLGKVREVIEMRVVAIEEAGVAIAQHFWCRGQNRNVVADCGKHAFATRDVRGCINERVHGK